MLNSSEFSLEQRSDGCWFRSLRVHRGRKLKSCFLGVDPAFELRILDGRKYLREPWAGLVACRNQILARQQGRRRNLLLAQFGLFCTDELIVIEHAVA